MKLAYGGVLFNDNGEVLLRESTNHWDDYVWTFAKGGSEPGETPEATALREVREETGVTAKIVCRLPGEFPGGTTINVYFLMSPIEETHDFDPEETQAVKWVSPSVAETLIAKTTNSAGQKRDLAVLKRALELRKQLYP